MRTELGVSLLQVDITWSLVWSKKNKHTFKNNSTAGTVDGWIAHELDTVCPYAVNGEKDAVNEDGTDDLQGVDYGRITPLIVAALKEAIAEIETLKTKVDALEGS